MTVKTKTIRETFEACQEGVHGHDKLVSGLRKTYDMLPSKDEFKEEFVQHLKYSLVIFQREAAVERTLDFAAKFIVSFAAEIESDEECLGKTPTTAAGGPTVKEENFMLFMFDFLLLSHNANDRAVRFRVCQLVNKLLSSLGNDAQIDDDLYNRIYKCMLQRLKDKCHSVRIQAVTALARLQDPEDAECPVITAYLYLIKHDPNYEVRRMVLSCIAPCRKTLLAILERTRDVKDTVRKLAFVVLSEKVSVKSLTFEQRIKLLRDGLKDRSDSVRAACRDKLLQAWLRTFQTNILELLLALDVEYNTAVGEDAVKAILEKANPATLIEDFTILDENHLVPEDKLTSEAALYWRCMCEHFKTLGAQGEELLDRILPSISDFCDYIQGYLKGLKPKTLKEDELEKALEREFVSAQLLKIAGIMDLSDEVGRKKMDKMAQEMIVSPNIPATIVTHLVAILNEINTDDEIKVTLMAEMIADIRESITVVEMNVTQDEIRQKELKLAGAKMELNLARDELEEAVEGQDFNRAAELKQKIVDLEATRDSILEETMNKTQGVRTEKNDAMTLFKCLTITSEILKLVSMKELNPTLRTLMDTLVLPCIKNEDPSVRNIAVLSLGLACYLNKDYALQNLLLFVQILQIDHEFIQVTSLNVIFDLLLIFGFEALQISTTKASVAIDETIDEAGDASEKSGTLLDCLLSILTRQLDSEDPEMRTATAEGMAKLLLTGRISSPKLLSRLLLLWYNPTTEEDTRLRQALASFFPMYAFSNWAHQESFGEAFLPTLETMFNAPLSSPLAKINDSQVAKFLVYLTDDRNLKQEANRGVIQETTVHDSLSLRICNAVLQDPVAPGTRTLCQALVMLNISTGNCTVVQDLQTVTKTMIGEMDNKVSINILKKLRKKLDESTQGQEEGEEEGVVDSAMENTDVEDKENVAPEENTGDERVISPESGEADESRARTESTETSEPTFKTPAVPRGKGKSKKTPATKTPRTRQSIKKSKADEGREEEEEPKTGRKTRGSQIQRAEDDLLTPESTPTEESITSETRRPTRSCKKIPALVFSTDSEEEEEEEDISLATPTPASAARRPTRSARKKMTALAFSDSEED